MPALARKPLVGDHDTSLPPVNPFANLYNPFSEIHPMGGETRGPVDPKADALASGHYAEGGGEAEGADNTTPFEWMHRIGDGAHAVAEKFGVHGLSGFDTFMGPVGAAFATNEFVEGMNQHDAVKVMGGGAGLVGAGAATIEGSGALISAATGTAVSSGPVLAAAGPASAAFGLGVAGGYYGNKAAVRDTDTHDYWAMTADEHRTAEGEKIDGNGDHTIAGGIRAAETALTDDAFSLVNTGITGVGGGVGDAIVASRRAAEKSQMERSLYDDMPVSEEPSMHVTSAPSPSPSKDAKLPASADAYLQSLIDKIPGKK